MYIQGTQKFNPDFYMDVDLPNVPFDLAFCWHCETYVVRIHTVEDKVSHSTMCTICHDNKKFAEAK